MYGPVALLKSCTSVYLCKKCMRIWFLIVWSAGCYQLSYLPIGAIYSQCNFNLYFSLSYYFEIYLGVKYKVWVQLNFFPDDIPLISTELLNSSSFSIILKRHLCHRLNSWKQSGRLVVACMILYSCMPFHSYPSHPAWCLMICQNVLSGCDYVLLNWN